MKNSYRPAPMIACTALGSLAWLAGASVAATPNAGARILSFSDMVTLTQRTEDQLEAARATNRSWRGKKESPERAAIHKRADRMIGHWSVFLNGPLHEQRTFAQELVNSIVDVLPF